MTIHIVKGLKDKAGCDTRSFGKEDGMGDETIPVRNAQIGVELGLEGLYLFSASERGCLINKKENND